MKIGFPNNPSLPLLKEIEWAGKNGFDFFELFSEEPYASPDVIDFAKVKRILSKYNLGVVGHIAWHLPIGSPLKKERDFAVKEAEKHFDIMEKIGISKVTIHSNFHPLLSEKESIEFQSDTLCKLVKNAEKRNIIIMLELLDSPRDTEKNIGELLDEIPDMFLNLDIGHSNLSGKNPERMIKKFGPKIAHVHMHDNDGIMDMHLPIGSGIINWPSVIKTLKKNYDGTITLEVFAGGKEFVLLSKKRLLKMWDSS